MKKPRAERSGDEAPKKKKKGPKVVGEVVMAPLKDVQPNDWNPNRMTPFEMESLRFELRTTGWLKSQSLLVWRTDETGAIKMIIIDGEQKYTAALAEGYIEGPMVFLDGITEAKAKKLTIALGRKRGKQDDKATGEIVAEIIAEEGDADLALALGIETENLLKLTSEEPEIIPEEEKPGEGKKKRKGKGKKADKPEDESAAVMGAHVRMKQLFFNEAQEAEFIAACEKLEKKYGTKTLTDTVFRAVTEAAKKL